MNSKAFKEPMIPADISEADDAIHMMEAAKETEEDITLCRIKGIFVTKFDAKRLSFKKVIFEL